MHKPTRAALIVCAGLMLMAGSGAMAKPKGPPGSGQVSALGGYALPSEIVASSIEWGHIAADKGWWNAMRTMATPDAQLLTTGTTARAQAYAKGRAEPATLPHRRTHHVWMSCDGSIGAEEGLYEDGPTHGWYVTIWQHQPKKGGYRWVLDQTGVDTGAAQDFDFIEGKVADCVPRARTPAPNAAPPPTADGAGPIEIKPIIPGSTPANIAIKGENNAMADYLIGIARDHTLGWATRFDADGTRHITVNLLVDGKRTQVLNRSVAPASANGQ
jgi:hypothetical protein